MEQDCKSCSTLLDQSAHTTILLNPTCAKRTQQILLNPTCAKRTHNKSCSTLLAQNAHNKSCLTLLDQSAHNKSCSTLLDQSAHTTNPAQPYLRKAHSMLLHSLKNDSDNTNVCITESAFSGVSLLPHGIIVSTFAAQTRNSKLKLLSR